MMNNDGVMTDEFRFYPHCSTPLASLWQMKDGEKLRLRCPACRFAHWNNPTPVLAGRPRLRTGCAYVATNRYFSSGTDLRNKRVVR